MIVTAFVFAALSLSATDESAGFVGAGRLICWAYAPDAAAAKKVTRIVFFNDLTKFRDSFLVRTFQCFCVLDLKNQLDLTSP